jgi:hypothetical protein
MHLHGRHAAHLTLPQRLKQARQSLAPGLNGSFAAGFPYSLYASVNRRGLAWFFVSNSLQAGT